jgi:hypothetical protein
MSRFARAAARLRKLGIISSAELIGGGSATYLTITGYTIRHLATSFLTGHFLTQTGRWIGNRDEAKIVDAVRAAGINTEMMSTGELTARLAYPLEIAQALTGLLSDSQSFVDHIVPWLRSMPTPQRRPAMQVVMDLASTMGSSAAKIEIAKSILAIDDATAQSLREILNIERFLRKLGAVSLQDRKRLIEAGFPVPPADSVRARLWAVINDANFPALEVVEPLARMASTHPDRMPAVRAFVSTGAPLPTCKPTPCRSCRTDFSCKPGSYLTEQFTCTPYAN